MSSDNSVRFDWVGVKEACDILGISRPTLHRLIREGYLPTYQIEGVRGYQFKREDVLGLIKRVDPEEFEENDDD